ncbi:NACHT domain-containing protein, partial [Streptomyces coeruleorubidus]|uniref:NACHT domain-containing protein n=1 Tax=Streptomyces coeruleorubidus TaxID=116188 RepID=UPI0037FD4259
MTSPAVGHVVAVRAADHGSGYLISPRLVLTAAHLVRDAPDGQNIRVTAPELGSIACDLVWSGQEDDCDAALLRTRGDLLPQRLVSAFGRRDWGELDSSAPLPGCQAIGFPSWMGRSDETRQTSEQWLGTLHPDSGPVDGGYLLLTDLALPTTPDRGLPWAGMSGAPVFAEGVLVGIVTASPRNRRDALAVLPAAAVLRQPGFRRELDPPPSLFKVSPDIAFERRYAEYVVQRHRLLTIYGVSLAARPPSWPLEAAYLRLQVTEPAKPTGDSRKPVAPVSVEQALAQHARVLLRGDPGSGKTTLLQWLAVSTARQDLGEYGQHRSDRVPFVLPLRSLPRDGAPLPRPEDFLSATGAPLIGDEPRGWVRRVLSAGRGLLLIDGLDELAGPDRARVKGWLGDLLGAFPANQCVVTSRPAAVQESWLANLGFTELALLPMSDRDVDGFIARWHEAARAIDALTEEREDLRAYEASLLDAVHATPHLRELATNPLMCGLICALHRERRGFVPLHGTALYDAALEMLLARRDRERAIEAVSELTAEDQLRLLSRFAYWLVRNGLTEAGRDRLVEIVQEALPFIGRAAAVDDAISVVDFLLERSGVLRASAVGTVGFVHRVFQDYLAARDAVHSGDFGVLIANAHDEVWEGVIRFSVAHARVRERTDLLTGLLSRADQQHDVAARLVLLALSCLEYAPELEPRVYQEVTERAARLLPPRTDADEDALARAGSIVLDLLPSPSSVTKQEAATLASLVRRIGGARSHRLAQAFTNRSTPPVRASTPRAAVPEDLSPSARDLAVALSPATRIEPELMRAVRLHVLPFLDVGAESDLWFSDWVASRTPAAIALRPDLLPMLRDELAAKLAAAEPDDPVNDLWEVISRVHADLSPALVLEERVTWIHLSGGRGLAEGVDQALQPALRALVDERRDGVADWLIGAWERLPEAVRRTTAAWQLATAALTRVPMSALEAPAPPDDLRIGDVAVIAQALADVPLPVSLRDNDLVIGTASGPGAVAVPVPDTRPRIIEVILDSGANASVQIVRVDDGDAVTLPVGDARIRLRTARGTTYELRSARPSVRDVTVASSADEPRTANPRLGTAGGDIGVAITGDGAQVVMLLAEAVRWAKELDAPAGTGNLPGAASSVFVGRRDELAELRRLLTDEGEGAVTQVSATRAIHGLDGIGKSTLALHYAHTHRLTYTLVWWINATDAEQIVSSLATLAMRLCPQWAATAGVQEQAAWAILWLQWHPGWLLVFDSVEDPADLRHYLGTLPGGHRLATSRTATGWHAIAPTMHLGLLDADSAVTLLCTLALGTKHAPTPKQRQDAAALAAELGYLPLALEQAGSYLFETGISLADYRNMLGQVMDVAAGGINPERTIARIWLHTLTAIERRNPQAVRVLNATAWLAPDDIPRTLLAPLCPDPRTLGEALGTLHAYDMISHSADRESIGVHRLVQTVLRHRPATEAAYPRGRQDAEHLIRQAMPGEDTNTAQWERLLPHVVSVAESTPPHSPASSETADVYHAAAQYLYRQGRDAHTIRLRAAALAQYEQILGDTHPDTLTSRNHLAHAYQAAGDLERAIPLYETTLAQYEQILGDTHPDTLTSRNHLAHAYQAAGD